MSAQEKSYARNLADSATLEAIAEMGLQWAIARDEAVATFGRLGADRHQLEAAWARLGRAERALLGAVQPLRAEEASPFDPKAHPLVGKRFRLKYEKGSARLRPDGGWQIVESPPGTIGKVIEVWPDCIRLEIEECFTCEWASAAAPYRMHEIVARFLDDVTPVEELSA